MGGRLHGHALAVALCLAASADALAVPRTQLRLTPQLGLARSPPPRLGFGLSPREMKRLSEMKRPDEPLVEEVRGLRLLGAVLFFLFTPGAPLIGAFLGFQAAPLLATLEGEAGERCRKAGWAANVRVDAACAEAKCGWAVVRRESDARGFTAALRKTARRVRAWDESSGASAKARTLATAVLALARGALARVALWARRSGLNARLRALWGHTGIPGHWETFKDRQVLNARMRHTAQREWQEGQGGGGGG